jgi:hypothetical protein
MTRLRTKTSFRTFRTTSRAHGAGVLSGEDATPHRRVRSTTWHTCRRGRSQAARFLAAVRGCARRAGPSRHVAAWMSNYVLTRAKRQMNKHSGYAVRRFFGVPCRWAHRANIERTVANITPEPGGERAVHYRDEAISAAISPGRPLEQRRGAARHPGDVVKIMRRTNGHRKPCWTRNAEDACVPLDVTAFLPPRPLS